MDRRAFVKACALGAAGLAVGGGAVLAGKALLEDDDRRPAPVLRSDGTPMRATDLADVRSLDGSWRGRPALVVRVPVTALHAASALHGVNTGQFAVAYPGSQDYAILAYDARCTHLGCTVAFQELLDAGARQRDYDGDDLGDGRAQCPCHESGFDVHDLGRNLPDQPAQRPLGVLRIGLDEGTIVAAGSIRQARAHDADLDGPGAPFRVGTRALR